MMPAEWAPHERTWMEFPPVNETFGEPGSDSLAFYRGVWTAVTNAIAEFEPVSLIANVGDGASAREMVGPNVTVHEFPINDAWFRDSGPTFVTSESGEVAATHWTFNGWGNAGFSEWDLEQLVGGMVAHAAGVPIRKSVMVNEGGGIHVDGQGTVMITETVQLGVDRNPGWTHGEVEAELRVQLGVEKVIWLPRGLTRDYDRFGTRGHIDIVASWVEPGLVVAHSQPDSSHPDFEVCQENIGILRAAKDARGRTLEVVEIEAPTVLEIDGEFVDYSYINHYICNGAIILCSFDDPRDEAAAATLSKLFPSRKIVMVDARHIFECGGGIHCITQQQPAGW